MDNREGINQKNKEINQLDFGSIEEVKSVFKNCRIHSVVLNDKIQSVFAPIRDCVKNCTSQLEMISDLFSKELQVMDSLNQTSISTEIFHLDEKIGEKQKDIQDFVTIVEQKLASYQEDLKQTKSAIQRIRSIFQKYKQVGGTSFDLEDVNEKVDKIYEQICLVESAMQQFNSRLNQDIINCTTFNTNEKEQRASDFKRVLLALLDKVQSNSKKQLALTEASLDNLEELSTFLQYEDIIGQKLEHIQEILKRILEGLSLSGINQNIEELPYFKLVPDLSALLISLLTLVQNEYQVAIEHISKNALFVKKNLAKFSSSAQNTHADIEQKLTVLNSIYNSLQGCLKKFYSQGHHDQNVSPHLESQLNAILINSCDVLNGILDISAGSNEVILIVDIGSDNYTGLISEVREMMSKIYFSINDIISHKKQIDDQNQNNYSELKITLLKFQQLSEQVISADKKHKSIIFQKSNLSDSLSKEIGVRLEEIEKNKLIDQIIEVCKKELEFFASKRYKREISEEEIDIYHQLFGIYTMDSERNVHQLFLKDVVNQETEIGKVINLDCGSIELF